MALTPTDFLTALLSKNLVESKVDGVPNSDVEGTAVFHTVLTALLTYPRSVLLIAYLARNRLLSAISDELTQVADLSATVRDLGNVSLSITDTSSLQTARSALLDMDVQGNLSANDSSYGRFDRAVSDFLRGPVASNVKTKGSTSLVRPYVEAVAALPADLAALEVLHADTLDRYYALVVGVQNFVASEAAGLLASSTVYRAQQRLADIIQQLEADPSGISSRDHVVSLLSLRAALKALSAKPAVDAPIVDTSLGLPLGHATRARTADCFASTTSLPGPWQTPYDAYLTLNGVRSLLPVPTLDIFGRAVVVGSQVAWPVTLPPYADLYLSLDGTTSRVQLNPTPSPVMATFQDIVDKLSSTLSAVEYGTGRLLLSTTAASLAVEVSFSQAHPMGLVVCYTNSAHQLLGLSTGKVSAGSIPVWMMLDGIRSAFSGQVSATSLSNGVIRLTAIAPNVPISVSGFPDLGLSNVSPSTDKLEFYEPSSGTVRADSLVDVGDFVSIGGATRSVVGFDRHYAVLNSPITHTDGPVTVTSSLVSAFEAFDVTMGGHLPIWLAARFAQDLTVVDRAVAPLYGSPTPANREGALNVLEDLQGRLRDLYEALHPQASDLPAGAATDERALVAGLVQTLTERKFDRAVDMLMRCQVREVFDLDWQSASYAGDFMRSMSDVAQNDMSFPNTTLNDETQSVGTVTR